MYDLLMDNKHRRFNLENFVCNNWVSIRSTGPAKININIYLYWIWLGNVQELKWTAVCYNYIAQKMKFSIKDFFSKCDIYICHIYWRNP